MGGLYAKGEEKIRPGVYRRVTNDSSADPAGAIDGRVAVVIQSNWGPLGEVSVLRGNVKQGLINAYGETGGANGTVKVAMKAIEGGATQLFVSRVGNGGTKGTLEVNGAEATKAATLTALYPGSRALSVTIREKLGDASLKELIVYDGVTELERMTFAAGESVVANLVDVVNKKSNYFTAEKAADSAELEAITQKAITPGTDPTVSNNDYSTAMTALEPFKFNTLCIDSSVSAVHLLVQAFIQRTHANGALFTAVIGEPITVDFDTRKADAAAFNDEGIIYVGGAYKSVNGDVVDGFMAAAQVAGMVASIPSNKSIVHKQLSGSVETVEKLTNEQYTDAILSGMLLFSESDDGFVWIDSGVNTLVAPTSDKDDGWKKIKRTKVRFELFDRLDRTVAPVIGDINCDSNGVANVIKLGTDVLNAMVAESKILPGASIVENPDQPYKGDSAWFTISFDDIDTLEKIYLEYHTRFTSSNE